MGADCVAVAAALAAGEAVDSEHVASCDVCGARASVVAALVSMPPMSPAVSSRPDARVLARAVRRRRIGRAAFVVGLAALVLLALFRAPAAPPPDLLAALDDADRVTTPVGALPGEDVLDLLDPADPLTTADPLVDALLGERSP